ncbi:universal stress protein [Mycobacterium sp. NPDC003449]
MTSGPAVVVGIDGSRSAVDAAIWAVKEAVSRDIAVRLTYVVDPDCPATDHQDPAGALATAERAVRQSFIAPEVAEQPVKIELEVLRDNPIHGLIAASRSAAMLCVGAVGLRHAAGARIGSTAAAVTKSAHCPVAVVRTAGAERGGVLAEFDGHAAAGAVLQAGMEEARLRGAPLRVMTAWRAPHRGGAAADPAGPPGLAVLAGSQCSLLTCDRRQRL